MNIDGRKKKGLNDDEKNLLMLCLKKHAPDLIVKFNQLDSGLLCSDDINEMREAVGSELANKGFKPDWEPNEYGLRLEDLISQLANLYMWPKRNIYD
jgi:hypothetical protein